MTLKGKTAVITGSNSGIGLGVAEELARAGADVVINSFTDSAEDHALAARIAAGHGVKARYIQADMSKPDDCRALVEKAGGCDILVNNAGIQFVAPIEEFPVEKWNAILAINLSSAFHTSAAALPGMRAKGWGRIVNIASVYGLVGGVQRSSYVASKHALVGLSKAVALETAATPVTCNAICPGDVSTRIFYRNAKLLAEREGIAREEAQRRIASASMPSGRVVSPAQVAALVAYLCSEAAAEIRGAALPVDGAWTAR